MIYRLVFRFLLQRIDPERAHRMALGALARAGRLPGLLALIRRVLGPRDPRLRVQAFGLTFASPLGVAAGLDKDATCFEALGALGFGFVEIGTVTATAQPGNPGTRIWRLPAHRAVLNSLGFPSAGATAVADRLRARTGHTIVGVNIGRSKVAAGNPGADYRSTVRAFGSLPDFLVVNVSSPNTPGLRDLQAVAALGELIAEIRDELSEIGAAVPLLIKIAPDLTDAEIDGIADLALRLGLDGIVAVNTTVDHSAVPSADLPDAARGGLSGAPLKARALEVLRRLRARGGDELVLVSVGGIESADDVWTRVRAGATLVQAHTGFVWQGPCWPSTVNRGLSRRLAACGSASLQDEVGSDAPIRRRAGGCASSEPALAEAPGLFAGSDPACQTAEMQPARIRTSASKAGGTP